MGHERVRGAAAAWPACPRYRTEPPSPPPQAAQVDFLDFSYLTLTDRVNSTETYTAWLRGMATAAAGARVSVQLCMDLPSDALLSTQLPRLSNARASEDDFPGSDSRWDIGVSSLLYAAVGLRPFYDDTWTAEYEPGSPYGPGAKETFVEVSVIIATLSTGEERVQGAGLAGAQLPLPFPCRRRRHL